MPENIEDNFDKSLLVTFPYNANMPNSNPVNPNTSIIDPNSYITKNTEKVNPVINEYNV